MIVTENDWEIVPMPEKHTSFTFRRHFEESEIENLKNGFLPREMEERWFIYYKDGKLYFHRSWTGNCIFILEFDFVNDNHKVTVNRDENQYNCTDTDEDKEQLNELLDCYG